MADSNNVTLRLPVNGGVDRPITYEELDKSFLELKYVIDEYNHFVQFYTNDIHFRMSKALFEQQLYFEHGVNDVFTISGNQLVVPVSTTIYQSGLIRADKKDYIGIVDAKGVTNGGLRVIVKGYDENGTQVVGSTDPDFTVNGTSRSFVESPTAAPVSNSQTHLFISITSSGLDKAEYYTIELVTTALGPFTFTDIEFRGKA